jgi:uncharacterized protein YcnI
LAVLLFISSAIPASAHVVVKPSQAGIASYQTFTMGVPNEKDIPTVAVRVLIPEGIRNVSPNVKPGWTIDMKRTGSGENAQVTEIDWTGGIIPPGQRDDFTFSAQTPPEQTTLKWNAYQVFEDGTTVAWIHEPSINPEDEAAPPPHSTTKVINDLIPSPASASASNIDSMKSLNIMMYVASIALILSIISLTLQLSGKKK